MKRTQTTEVEICDFCEEQQASSHTKCMGCGKAICYDCRKTRAKEYNHAVYFQGSGDGLYCLECDKRLTATGDPLHAAYRVIGYLRDESKAWGEAFKVKIDKAEANLKRLSVNG
jgi:hypothetical protein